MLRREGVASATLIFGLMLAAGPMRGQEPSAPPPASVVAPAPTTSTEPAPSQGRQVSWKLLAPNILHDQKAIWLFPARAVQGQHWKPTLAVVLGTAAMVALDPHDTPYFRRTDSFSGFNKVFSGPNTAIGTAALPLAFYAVGLARRDSYTQQTALFAGQAVVDTEILTTVLKNITARVRPVEIPLDGDYSHTWFKSQGPWFSGRGSFPSGHTSAAFSVATVLAERYNKHRWVPWVAYGLAGLVGFSRVPLQSHFPSEVFAGAALGFAISRYVVLQHP